jgi:hypothetical protein
MERVTVKSSTIFISVGDKTRVYRSVEDVPADLRQKLIESTNGMNSATVLIADRGGREEIVRALRGLPSGVQSRLASTMAARRRDSGSKGRTFRFTWQQCAEILLPSLLGLAAWLLLTAR